MRTLAAISIASALRCCDGKALRPNSGYGVTIPARAVCDPKGGTCPEHMNRLFCALRQHTSDVHPEVKVAEMPPTGKVQTGMGPVFKQNVRYLLFDSDDTSGLVGMKCSVQSAMACKVGAKAKSGKCGHSTCIPDVRSPVLGYIRLQLGGSVAAFAAGAAGQPPSRTAVIGVGAGSLPSWILAALPDVSMDAVDINGPVMTAATECFGLPKDDDRLRTHVEDGMQFLKSQEQEYDLVMLDVVPLPKHFRKDLTTISSRLSAHYGVLAVNGWKTDEEFVALQQDVMKTFKRVWLATDSNKGNQILLARLGSPKDLPKADELKKFGVPADAVAWSTEQPWEQLK